jgi:hypothetical protein
MPRGLKDELGPRTQPFRVVPDWIEDEWGGRKATQARKGGGWTIHSPGSRSLGTFGSAEMR